MKILFCGYFGAGNFGDDMILLSQLKAFRKILPGAEFNVLVFDKYQELSAFNCRGEEINFNLIRIKRGFNFILSDFYSLWNSLRKNDFIILGGGGLFQDLYNIRMFSFLSVLVMISRFLRKRIIFYSVGIGPFRNKLNRILMRFIAEKADIIITRDAPSKDLLIEMGVEKNIYLGADSVFLLDPWLVDIKNILRNNHSPSVAVVLSDLFGLDRRVKESLALAFDSYMAKSKLRMVFIPFGKYNYGLCKIGKDGDVKISEEIAGLMKNRDTRIIKNKSLLEMLGILKEADLIIGMRLHSLIISMLLGKPFLALTYGEDNKIKNLMKEFDFLDYCIDLCSIDSQVLTKKIEIVLRCSKRNNFFIQERARILKERAESANFLVRDFILENNVKLSF